MKGTKTIFYFNFIDKSIEKIRWMKSNLYTDFNRKEIWLC